MRSSDRDEHIRNLEAVLTALGEFREDVNRQLKAGFNHEIYLKSSGIVTLGVLLVQQSVAGQLQRLRERRD